MADFFDPVWAVDGDIYVPSEAEIRLGFTCGPASPNLFNYLFQTLQTTINSIDLSGGIPVSRQVGTTEGVKGGGTLEADRLIRLDIGGLSAKTTIANDDYVVIYRPGEGQHYKISRSNFVAGLTGGGGGGGDPGLTGAENIGDAGGDFFASLSGTSLQFRRIKNGGGLSFTTSGSNVVGAIADMGTALTVE